MKSYQVTYLLSLSTLPARFYSLVYSLTGRAADYGNPGVSLRSFIISRCVNDEIVQLDEQAEALIRECEEFSSSRLVLQVIIDSLFGSATEVMLSMVRRASPVQVAMLKDVTELQELAQTLKATYDAFLSIQEQGKVDLFTMPGIKLKQCTFDLQDKIGEITAALNHKVLPPEAA